MKLWYNKLKIIYFYNLDKSVFFNPNLSNYLLKTLRNNYSDRV